jgi:hypothetical protein
VVERYDVGTEGMEQSFVFATRPGGQGDLVVRGRMRTDMQVTHERGGLRIEQPGVGGFSVGAVTGIDARGECAQGSVRYDDGIVELSLPAAFVENAVYPLVLDPLVGIAFGLNLITGFDDRRPHAAFDASNDCYLVVWSNVFSATDTDIHGQRISRAGSLLGTRIFIDSSTFNDIEPSVCNVNASNAFVVVFNRAGDISGRAVNASNGAVAVGIPIATGSSNQHAPSVGGNPVEGLVISGNAVCVWESDAEPAILAARLLVNVDLSLSLGTVHTLVSGTTSRASRPRISKSAGSTGRYAVAFSRVFFGDDPWAMVVSSSAAPLTAPLPLDPRNSHSNLLEVDGDGTNWVVVWQDDEFGSADRQVIARSLSFATNPDRLLAGPFTPFLGANGINERAPAVIRTGSSTLLAWTQGGTSSLARVGSIDPFRCRDCEGAFTLGAADITGVVNGCAALSGGGPPDDALLVWPLAPAATPSNSDIMARFWRSDDGVVSSLGGGCGTGGSAQATCVRVPNAEFAHRLRGATPNAGTFLLQSLGQESATCGPCTRTPTLNGGVVLFFVTDSAGNAVAPSSIPDLPALRGLVQFDQWFTLRSGGACSQFDIDMSNALRIVIQ